MMKSSFLWLALLTLFIGTFARMGMHGNGQVMGKRLAFDMAEPDIMFDEPMIEPMIHRPFRFQNPSPLRQFSWMVGVSLPEGPAFGRCFRPAGVELMHQLKLAGRASDDAEAIQTIRKALQRASGSLNSCGATEMATYFTVLVTELDPATAQALVKDVIAIIRDAKNGDRDAVARDLADALRYAVPLIHCKSDSCRLFANILRVLQIEASTFSYCRHDIESASQAIETLAHSLDNPNFDVIVGALEQLLRAISGAGEACGIANAADVFSVEAGKLVRAIEKKVDGTVHVIVEGLDITRDIHDIVVAIADGQWGAAGAAMAKLVGDLRLSSCQDKWCIFAQAILDSTSIIFRDLKPCEAELKKVMTSVEEGEKAWKAHDFAGAVKNFGEGAVDMAEAVEVCGIPELAGELHLAGERLGNATIQTIADKVQVLVHGVDIFADVGEIVEDLFSGHWADAGHELMKLIQDISTFGCESEFCDILEGALRIFGVFLPEIPMCEAEIEEIGSILKKAKAAWDAENYLGTLEEVAHAFDVFARGLKDCGLDTVAELILAEVAKITHNPQIEKDGDGIIHIIVGGLDLYDDIYTLVHAIEEDNWTLIGRTIAAISKDLASIGVKSDAMKVFEGILTVISDVFVDLGPCQDEMETAWASMRRAMDDIAHGDYKGAGEAAGSALLDTAHAIHTCHLDSLGVDIVVVAELLHMAKVEHNAEGIVNFIVGGLSIIDDLHLTYNDYKRGDMAAVGRDIGDIIAQVRALAHHNCDGDSVCLISNAFLMGINILPNLKECAGDFVDSYNDIILAMHHAGKGDWKRATIDIGKALHMFAQGLEECDVPEIVDILTKVAGALLGPEVAVVGNIIHVIINGVEIADDVYSIYIDYEDKNWIQMGLDLAKLVELLI